MVRADTFGIRNLIDLNLFHRDVHVGLIGYSENMKWPQHYTVHGDTNIQGEVKNIKFNEKKPAVTLEVCIVLEASNIY